MGFSSLFSFLWHCQWIGIGYPLALNGFLLWIISAFILRVNKSQLTTNKSSLNLSEWTIKTEGSEYLFFFLFLCSLNGACHWSPYGYARCFSTLAIYYMYENVSRIDYIVMVWLLLRRVKVMWSGANFWFPLKIAIIIQIFKCNSYAHQQQHTE